MGDVTISIPSLRVSRKQIHIKYTAIRMTCEYNMCDSCEIDFELICNVLAYSFSRMLYSAQDVHEHQTSFLLVDLPVARGLRDVQAQSYPENFEAKATAFI